MANTRRKRTEEEQRLYEEIESLKRQRSEQTAEITRRIEFMYAVTKDEETDAILGGRARDVLAARREVDRLTVTIENLQVRYEALRARAAEDVPL